MEKKLQKIHFIENIKHHIFIINLLLMVIFTSLMGCKKKDLSAPETPIRVPKPEGTIVYSTALLDSVSKINKTTSWYNTNKSFDELFDEKLYLFS